MGHRGAGSDSRAWRSGVLALAIVGAAAAAWGGAPVPAAAQDGAAEASAIVRVSLLDDAGHEIPLGGPTLSFEQSTSFTTTVGDHEHAVTLSLHRGPDAESVALGLEYAKDGGTVIAAKQLRAQLGKPASLRSADGSAKLVVLVSPRGKLDVGDSDDPLDGM